MEPKKNPKANLDRYSIFFFLTGLNLVLFLTWIAFEMKTYVKEDNVVDVAEAIHDFKEDIHITETLKNVPPPPAAVPNVIEIVEDVVEVEETVIGSTETDQDEVVEERIVDVGDVEVAEEEEEISVPFAIIEDVPVFPGCEGRSKAEQRACFQSKIQEHIKAELNYPEFAKEMGIQGKVYVRFIIDPKGRVSDIQTRGPHDILEKEAQRIIAALPQMTPGKQRGKAVTVPYSIPIYFKII